MPKTKPKQSTDARARRTIRMSDAEWAAVCKAAQADSRSAADYVRLAALEKAKH